MNAKDEYTRTVGIPLLLGIFGIVFCITIGIGISYLQFQQRVELYKLCLEESKQHQQMYCGRP